MDKITAVNISMIMLQMYKIPISASLKDIFLNYYNAIHTPKIKETEIFMTRKIIKQKKVIFIHTIDTYLNIYYTSTKYASHKHLDSRNNYYCLSLQCYYC
jgi:hypothetical protein